MTIGEILTAIGLIISIILGAIGAYPQIRKLRSDIKSSDTVTEGAAFELSEKYGKKVLELEARLTHIDDILNGDLDLKMKVPMSELIKNGSAPFTGMAHIIKKDENSLAK